MQKSPLADARRLGELVGDVVRTHVASVTTPLLARIESLEKTIEALSARPVPKDGRGVSTILLDDSGSLRFVMTDGEVTNLGHIHGIDGEDGADAVVDPAMVEAVVSNEVEKQITVVGQRLAADYMEQVKTQAVAAIAAIPMLLRDDPAYSQQIVDMINPIVTAKVDALPKPRNGHDADPRLVEIVVREKLAEAMAEIPPAKDGHTPTAEELEPIVLAAVEKAVAALPKPKDGEPGKSITIEDIRPIIDAELAQLSEGMQASTAAMEERVVANMRENLGLAEWVSREVTRQLDSWPQPKNGKDADPALVSQLVDDAVSAAFATMPVPRDGSSVTIEDVAPLVKSEVEAQVAARLAEQPDLQSYGFVTAELLVEAVTAEVVKQVSLLPKPKDGQPGKSVTVDDVKPLIAEEVSKIQIDVPEPRGIKSLLIDRHGHLIVTMSDGSLSDVGPVVGADADMDQIRSAIIAEVEKIPRPKDGKDGLGFDDLSIHQPDDRRVTLAFRKGAQVKEFTALFPVQVNRGVYKQGERYERGDLVTFGGSQWHCEQDTDEKPGETAESWRLAVKRGRDGRDGKDAPQPFQPVTLK